MSLYKHSTEPKVKVQTAQGEGKGPLLLLSHLSTCLRTGTHWVEKLGSCGSTVGVGRGRRRVGDEPQAPLEGVVRNSGLSGMESPLLPWPSTASPCPTG